MRSVSSVGLATIKFFSAAAIILALLYACAWFLGPDLQAPAPTIDQAELSRVEADRKLLVKEPSRIQQPVDYQQGQAAAWWPKGEAPVLAELVSAGDLPPVHERTGSEPLVLEGSDGVGRYGGTWFRIASNPGDSSVMAWRLSGATMVRWSPMGHPVVPHVARDFSVNADQTVYTFHLRKGMRWSDGAPFTADDILYWWKDDVLGLGSGTAPKWMRVDGEVGDIHKIDAHTVEYRFPKPHGLFLELLASQHTWALPKHYLKPFHPKLGDDATRQAEADKRGIQEPLVLYNKLKAFNNVHHPRLWPWIYRTETANPPYVWVRNPYYFAVDTEGKQLPYIDQVHFAVKQGKLITPAAAQGEVSMQRRHIKFQDYTLLMNGRDTGNYDVYHWYPATRSEFTIFPNRDRMVPDGDAHAAAKARLLKDKRFRQALSLAIDRQAIIRTFYYGQTEAAQIDPGPDSPFHSPELYRSFIAHDPAKANALLDALGLDQRDADGFRTADGVRLAFYLNTCSEWTGEGPGPFLVKDWADVGLRVIVKDRARSLWNSEKLSLQHDLTVWSGESEFMPLLAPRNFIPTYSESFYAIRAGIWYDKGAMSGKAADIETARKAGGQKPDDPALLANLEDYNRILNTPDEAARLAIWKQIAARCAEHVFTISICTHPPQPVVVKNDLRNVPRLGLDGAGFYTPGNTGIETYFWAEGATDPAATLSPGAKAALGKAMLTVTDRYSSTSIAPDAVEETASGIALGTILMWCFWGSMLILILMAAFRHPFVMRRLLIMVPTLLIISFIGFTVIQLPQGDFLETKISELRMSGNDTALEEAKRLKGLFHYEDSSLSKYAHWMGLTWFTSFADEDRGLLQGDLGRSMENGERVNDLVGDRIVLTMLISFFSILLTWAIALVTGTYSAVKQYTTGDYVLTFISFIGMSVPGFLLALVLIYLARSWFGISVTGLFSPEYAAQPEWDMGKIWDLAKHMWVPVLVAGVGGTASLFRVMRGNLLDELRKPYVTTARAKGMRPIPLLVKYPVRVALNPVVSTIGHLFPALVSGSAIIAIVLSLPTVGPLMLNALMTEDMYLAGSMLMVLSLLGIFGTLISDLLLLWLDPRIRMEGGKK